MILVEHFQVLLAVRNSACFVLSGQDVGDKFGRQFTQFEILLDDAVDCGHCEACPVGQFLEGEAPVFFQELSHFGHKSRTSFGSATAFSVCCVSFQITILEFVEPNTNLCLRESQVSINVLQSSPDGNGCGTTFLHEFDCRSLLYSSFQGCECHQSKKEQEQSEESHSRNAVR